MNTATTTTTPALASMPARKGWDLPCPCCGDAEAVVFLRLHMPEGEEFRCESCEEDFGLEYVRRLLKRWSPVVQWLDAMPGQDDA